MGDLTDKVDEALDAFEQEAQARFDQIERRVRSKIARDTDALESRLQTLAAVLDETTRNATASEVTVAEAGKESLRLAEARVARVLSAALTALEGLEKRTAVAVADADEAIRRSAAIAGDHATAAEALDRIERNRQRSRTNRLTDEDIEALRRG